MRPRPDAAENRTRQSADAPIILCASMRPRPDAAENTPVGIVEHGEITLLQ